MIIFYGAKGGRGPSGFKVDYRFLEYVDNVAVSEIILRIDKRAGRRCRTSPRVIARLTAPHRTVLANVSSRYFSIRTLRLQFQKLIS